MPYRFLSLLLILAMLVPTFVLGDGETSAEPGTKTGSTPEGGETPTIDEKAQTELKKKVPKLQEEIKNATKDTKGTTSLRGTAEKIKTEAERLARSTDMTQEQAEEYLYSQLQAGLSEPEKAFLEGVRSQSRMGEVKAYQFQGKNSAEIGTEVNAQLRGIEHQLASGAITREQAAERMYALSLGLKDKKVTDLPVSVLPSGLGSFAKGAFAANGICTT